MNIARTEMEQMFKDQGIDIDLSEINFTDDPYDVISKMHEKIGDQFAKMSENQPPPKPKTKRQIEKERKEQELENLQKRGLATIYKQLAKVLHPDLEQDPILKKEKEELMKKLTTAYQKNDLHTLLSLEMEWMSRSENNVAQISFSGDEQMKIYNSLLKEQTEMLQHEIDRLSLHPRYFSIQYYLSDDYLPPLNLMLVDLEQMRTDSRLYQKTINGLQSSESKQILTEILEAFSC
jgi:hypothetical protein